MAITISTTPDTYSAAGMPMLFTVTSDRDDSVALSTVSFSDYSGTVAGTVLATKTSHGLLSGDIVTVSNTSMDGTYEITKVDANTFYFTATYDSGDTSGNVERINNSFQIKADVKNGAGTTTWATLRKEGVSGVYTFDVSEILEAQLTSTPQTLGGTSAVCNTDAYETYKVTFTEEFDDEDGVLKTADSDTSGVLAAIPGSTQYDEDQDMDDYVSSSGDNGLFLTNSPALYISRSDEVQLSLITDSAVQEADLYLYLTDSDGNNTTQTLTTVNLATGGSQLAVFPINTSKFGSNVQADVYARDRTSGGTNQISETKTIYIDDDCNNGIRIWWLNALGAWDSYTFRIKPDKTVVSEAKTYSTDNSTKKNYTKKVQSVDSWEEYTVESTYLRTNEPAWLAEIWRSTDVRMQESDGTFRRIVVTNDAGIIDGEDIVKMTLSFRIAEGLK